MTEQTEYTNYSMSQWTYEPISEPEISTGNSDSNKSLNVAITASSNDLEFLRPAELMAYRLDPRLHGFNGKLHAFSPSTSNRLVVVAIDVDITTGYDESKELIIGSAVAILYKPNSPQNLSNSPVCALKTISVLPDYRRQGIGGKLVNYLLKYYRQPIVCYINCRSIEENFELSMNSLSFFKSIGGKIINNFDKRGSIKVILLPKCQ